MERSTGAAKPRGDKRAAPVLPEWIDSLYQAATMCHRVSELKIEAFGRQRDRCAREKRLPAIDNQAPPTVELYEEMVGRLAEGWFLMRPSLALWDAIMGYQEGVHALAGRVVAAVDRASQEQIDAATPGDLPALSHDVSAERQREDRALHQFRDFLRRCPPAQRSQAYLYVESLGHDGGGIACSMEHGERNVSPFRPRLAATA